MMPRTLAMVQVWLENLICETQSIVDRWGTGVLMGVSLRGHCVVWFSVNTYPGLRSSFGKALFRDRDLFSRKVDITECRVDQSDHELHTVESDYL